MRAMRDMRRHEVGSQLKQGQAVLKEWCERCGAPDHVGVIHSFDEPRALVAMLCRDGATRFICRWMLRPLHDDVRGLSTLRKLVKLSRAGKAREADRLSKKLARIRRRS